MTSTERYLVISADCHAGLPSEQYRDWLDPEFRPAFDDHLAERRAMISQLMAGDEDFARRWEEENAEGLQGAWDAGRRDKELDQDGVAGEVIFPDADSVTGGASPPFGAGLGGALDIPPDRAFAGAHAHNRWLAELCRDSPERRAGIALVPVTHDPVRAEAEVRWAHDQGLRGGILIPGMWGTYPPYHDRVYDPVWAACQELGMPVNAHSGPAPRHEYGEHLGIYASEAVWWASRPLWFLLWSGVFERFPELRFVVTESAAYWAPDLLWKMDTYFAGSHTTKKMVKRLRGSLRMLPSEYFDRNCFIGASTMTRVEVDRRYDIGVGNILWGNDYPHPEGTWPHTVEKLRDTFGDVPVEETRQMLGTSAAAVYGFDPGALAPLVARIGPTPADLGQTPEAAAGWERARTGARAWLAGLPPVDYDPAGS
jgi:predicted TIM-barrel fold metal-dependent hydrolase